MHMPASDHQVPIVMPAITSPTVASEQATVRFHRRSPIRSDTQPQAIMLIAPQT